MKEHREQDVAKSGDVLSEALNAVLDDAQAHFEEVESGIACATVSPVSD